MAKIGKKERNARRARQAAKLIEKERERYRFLGPKPQAPIEPVLGYGNGWDRVTRYYNHAMVATVSFPQFSSKGKARPGGRFKIDGYK